MSEQLDSPNPNPEELMRTLDFGSAVWVEHGETPPIWRIVVEMSKTGVEAATFQGDAIRAVGTVHYREIQQPPEGEVQPKPWTVEQVALGLRSLFSALSPEASQQLAEEAAASVKAFKDSLEREE